MEDSKPIKRWAGRHPKLAVSAIALALLTAAGTYYAFATRATPAAEAASHGARGKGERASAPGAPNGGARVQPVKGTAARRGSLDVEVAAIGTVTASNTVIVKPRVDGQIVRINFREGQTVKAGDILAEIDPRPFQIQLDQIRGQLLRDEALLAAARVDLDRYKGLLDKDSIARQQVNTQEALVRQYQGSVHINRAQEANARLNLAFTRIAAPAGGRIGLRQVDVGNMLRSTDSNGIAVITQTRPIFVVFAIPAERLGNIAGRLQQNEKLLVEVWDRENRSKLSEGYLHSIDNQIDVATGTIKLKAEIPNGDDSLFPNQFVNARLKVETRQGAVLLQSAAVLRNPQGTQVFVVGNDQRVEARNIRLGPANGNQVVIEAGLSAGETVVLDGVDRLQNGGRVELLSVNGQPVASQGERRGSDAAGRREPGQQRPRDAHTARPSTAGVSPFASVEFAIPLSLRLDRRPVAGLEPR